MKKIKGEFPRVRARITSKHTLFAFTTFTDGRWVFIKMTGKPRYFPPKYGTFHSLYQADFVARLKNGVPNTLAFHCVSVDYIRFCEGCESKKCKNAGCARSRARAREVQKTKIWRTQNGSRKCDSFFSKHPIKTSDVFQKTLDIFPKTWEVFPKTWEII